MNILAVVLVVVLILIVLAIVLLWTYPVHLERLRSKPNPVKNFSEVAERLATTYPIEDGTVDCIGETILLDHGQRTEWAIGLIHGYTLCPEQFRNLGERFYSRGYNILIPRQPRHGLLDRMNNAQARLKAEEMVRFTDNVVDTLHGLGRHTILCGLSGGGTMTAWAAVMRPDLDIAMPIAPFLGPGVFPAALRRPVMGLLLALPNWFMWWDKERKMGGGLNHAYPRFSSRTLGNYMRLGELVLRQARKQPPVVPSVVMVTNDSDHAIHNGLVDNLARLWQAKGAKGLKSYTFPLSLHVGHDLIDPAQPDQQIETVYPKLIEEIESSRRYLFPSDAIKA